MDEVFSGMMALRDQMSKEFLKLNFLFDFFDRRTG